MSYEGDERRAQVGWHVDKTLSIGNVITTVVAIITMIWFIAGQDQRISANTINIEHSAKVSLDRDLQIERTHKDSEQRATRTVERIEEKLDKIFEYVRGQK
tara:strand:- start:960 stop:1262 length:303 start_codon:yes stop_codon:yes gene_type:complete